MSSLRLQRALSILGVPCSPETARDWPSLDVAGKVGLLAARMACQMYFPLPSNYRAYRQSVHARLVKILRQNPGCRFLEIGVVPTFRQERFRAINDLGIHYVGLDFEHVCAERRADLAAPGIADRNIAFLGNPSGTYLFNLIRLARIRETFDIIYLDGSHSIYVDLVAAIAAVRLLTPHALFLFEDVRFCFGSRHLIQTTARMRMPMRAGN